MSHTYHVHFKALIDGQVQETTRVINIDVGIVFGSDIEGVQQFLAKELKADQVVLLNWRELAGELRAAAPNQAEMQAQVQAALQQLAKGAAAPAETAAKPAPVKAAKPAPKVAAKPLAKPSKSAPAKKPAPKASPRKAAA